MSDEPSHYDLLGVPASASKDEIRAAYQDKLANVRAGRTKEEATRRPSDQVISAARDEEARLRAAWQVLSDPVQRQRYDDRIGVDDDVAEGELLDDEDTDTPEEPRAVAPASAAQSIVTPEGLEIPGTGRRATAAAIDTVTLIAIWAAIFYPVTIATGIKSGTPILLAFSGTMAFLMIAYLIVPTWRGGQTLGKRYTYCMVVDRATGDLPSLNQVVRRYLIPLVAVVLLQQTGLLIALMYGYSFALNRRDDRSLADRMAQTAVVIARYRPDRSA